MSSTPPATTVTTNPFCFVVIVFGTLYLLVLLHSGLHKDRTHVCLVHLPLSDRNSVSTLPTLSETVE